MTVFSEWQNFYVIVGSSAGALIGLQFVVMTLLSEMPVSPDMERASSAFATPTIVHFGAVLLLAAMGCVPWHSVTPAAISIGILGGAGLVYVSVVTRRIRKQKAYSPEVEDQLFHIVLPFAGYGLLAGSGFSARSGANPWLFGTAGAALLLLIAGIHNAWDAVTYHVLVIRKKNQQEEVEKKPA